MSDPVARFARSAARRAGEFVGYTVKHGVEGLGVPVGQHKRHQRQHRHQRDNDEPHPCSGITSPDIKNSVPAMATVRESTCIKTNVRNLTRKSPATAQSASSGNMGSRNMKNSSTTSRPCNLESISSAFSRLPNTQLTNGRPSNRPSQKASIEPAMMPIQE